MKVENLTVGLQRNFPNMHFLIVHGFTDLFIFGGQLYFLFLVSNHL